MSLAFYVKKVLFNCRKDQWSKNLREITITLMSQQKQAVADKIQGYIDATDARFEDKKPTPVEDGVEDEVDYEAMEL